MQVPRVTLRRLMVYVALIAIVPQAVIPVVIILVPRVEAAGRHWSLCRQQASQSYQLASAYRAFASRYGADEPIPGVTVRQTEKGPVIPATGKGGGKYGPAFRRTSAKLRASEVATLGRHAVGTALAKAVNCRL